MKKLLLVAMVLLLAAGPALAGDMMADWANSSSYGEKVPGMLLRGVANALVTPFDLVMGIVHGTMDGPPVGGTLTGVLTGAENVFDRGGRAIMDVVGAPFPKFNGFGDYKPCPLTGRSMGAGSSTEKSAAKK